METMDTEINTQTAINRDLHCLTFDDDNDSFIKATPTIVECDQSCGG